MRLASHDGESWREEQEFRVFRLLKRIRQFWRFRPGTPRPVLFVVGCQRSGTSLLAHIFRRDWNVVSFDEVSPLSSRDPEKLRWNALPEVRARILGCRAGMVVCKPLVESQHLGRLLEAIPGSRAIWLYRDVNKVALSNLKFFGQDNGHKDLAPVLAAEPDNWRSEQVTAQQQATVARLAAQGLSDLDAAALFWWLRNSLYFQGGAPERPAGHGRGLCRPAGRGRSRHASLLSFRRPAIPRPANRGRRVAAAPLGPDRVGAICRCPFAL